MNEVDTNAKIIWDYMLMHQKLKPSDAIFILGNRDLRTGHYAADLYFRGLGQFLICSGCFGIIPEFTKSEAETFADLLIERGVPAEKILIEDQSRNTGENVRFVKKLLEEEGLPLRSFILVQKPFMERRTYATFKKQWPEAECIVASPQLSYEEYETGEAQKNRFINSMVGDFQRIKEYPAKGFQIPQEIPDNVWHAYEKLVEFGYTKHLIKD